MDVALVEFPVDEARVAEAEAAVEEVLFELLLGW